MLEIGLTVSIASRNTSHLLQECDYTKKEQNIVNPHLPALNRVQNHLHGPMDIPASSVGVRVGHSWLRQEKGPRYLRTNA